MEQSPFNRRAFLAVSSAAIAAQEQLVRKAPARVDYRRDLAVSCNNLGRVLLEGGDLSEADRALEQAQGHLQNLTADYPKTVEPWASVGGVLNNRAMLREKRGDLEGAAELFEQAVECLDQARALSHEALEPREFLAQTLQNYAGVLQALNRCDDAQRAPRLPPSRRRTKNRTRRLAFEVCEPRWPLTALLELPSAVDAAADEDSLGIEALAEVFETPFPVRDGDFPESDDADLGRREPSPEVPSDEIVADESDNSQPPGWNTLDAGLEPVWLSASLDESLGSSTEATLTDPFSPFLSTANQPEDTPERDSPDRQPSKDCLAIVAPSAVPSALEAERREWTAAGMVRYPLADGWPASPPVGTKFPPQATTASAGFLDVGRLVTTGTARRGGDSALLPRLELAVTETPSSSLATDLPVPLSANSPVTHKTPGAAAPVRPSLTGENRGQRMMLLASAHARPRRPTMAPSFPVSVSKPETPQVQARADSPSLRADTPRSQTGPSSPPPATLGSLPTPPPATAPLVDGRVSRSTMEGFAVFVLFAAGLFRKTHRRPRQPLQGIAGANPFDPQQAAARDEFFEQIQRADSA